ncbi:hypothetical protein BP5796_13186 [Coleophoma crateriformis]|uniref:Asl1-like glycosyl hydrolase catalytic domain-containing protein n=1 Tax=Coleophoma crateriformis TaxID=565419 RepID=A0A3D8Q3Z6_9HELO|nr:hypothetical protein BP5796_13186 [Coleophoma crateriformis]
MHLLAQLPVVLAVLPTLASGAATFQKSSKRGLVFVPNSAHPSDNQIWVESGSDLTWYYNYGLQPSSAYANRTQSEFEFVPMLWGAPSSTSDNTFLNGVKALISGGQNISHVLTFNEPDGSSSTGGSNVDPAVAATTWIREIVPLQKQGVKCGAPAVTGSNGGFTWLASFFDACQSQGTNCTADFIPIHWYGNFEGLASHIGQVVGTYPNTSIWITEYALNNADLADSQSFFNTSAEYFDRLSYVDRYSYFGSFRSSVSNVGPNAAMLTQKGELTDIGSWYLGGAATNNIPKASAASQLSSASALYVGLAVVGAGFALL